MRAVVGGGEFQEMWARAEDSSSLNLPLPARSTFP